MLHDLISREFMHAERTYPETIRTAQTVDDVEHGRLECRQIRVLSVQSEHFNFPGIRQVAELTRTRLIHATGKIQQETIYLITNLTSSEASAQRVLELKRDYWQIENCLHYEKDFVFGEDRQTARSGHGPRVLSAMRNLAVSIMHLLSINNIKRCVDNLKRDPMPVLQALCF